MIIDFFINLLASLLNLLPALPTGISLAFTDIYFVFNKANYYFPVQEVFVCIGIWFVVTNYRVGFSIIKWLAERIVI